MAFASRSSRFDYQTQFTGDPSSGSGSSLPALDPTLNLQLFKPWLCVILTLSLVLLPAASPSLINAQLCEPRIRSGQGNQWLTAQHIRRRIAISTPSHFNHGG